MSQITSYFSKLISNQYYFFVILALVTIIARLATWFFPLDSDHWIFFVVGDQFIHGKVLYAEIWDHKPPLIFLINGLMSLFLGDSIFFHRIFITIWMLLELFLFYLLLKKVLSLLQVTNIKLKARFGILGYAFWRNLSQFTNSGNNTENFGLIFLIGLYLTYLKYKENRQLRWLWVSGFAFSILIFLKPNFVLLSVPIWLDLASELIANLFRRQWAVLWIFVGQTIFKSLIFLIPTLIQAGLWIWYFLANGALWDFWFGFYEFSSKYLKSTWQGAVSGQTIFVLISLPFYILYISFLALFFWQNRTELDTTTKRFVFFTGLAGFVFMLILGSFYAYYYLILVPILILLIVSTNWSKISALIQKILVVLILTSSLASYLISLRQLYNGFAGPVALEQQELLEIADYIKQNTTPKETIYAYVYGATFYQLADRQPASSFISGNVLILDYRENYGYDLSGQVVADLINNRPPLVIIYKDNKVYEINTKLMFYLDQCYKTDKEWTNYKVIKVIDCHLNKTGIKDL